MHDVSLVHPGGGGVVGWGEELVQSAIRYNNFCSWFRVRTVVTFAGWAKIHRARGFNSSELSQANTRKMSMIDGDLVLGFFLRV